MLRNFWKATLMSLAVYATAILIGFWGGFQITLFAVPVFQITWTLFCVMRIIQLRRGGGHKADAPQYDRESYGFALGGLVSSTALLVVLVVLTQVV
jgi:ribose/xylose/arabinose/galactoside ABC-type transport system permease subunit